MEHQASAHHEEHPPTTVRQYVMIGIILAVITLIELWLSYSGLPHNVMIAGLLIFSAIKFVIVVAMFMHLRFDSKLFTRLFVFGMALAAILLIAVVTIFNFDTTIARDLSAAPPPPAAGHGDGGSEGSGDGVGEGNGEVKGQPVAEFFAANCAACHGQNREGLVGPALTPERLTEPTEVYFDTIKNGRPGTAMPAWGTTGLSDQDIASLVTFVTTVEP